MGRDLLTTTGSFNGQRIVAMNTHLESGAQPNTVAIRKQQLNAALKQLLSYKGPAVFAGDLNLREGEAKQVCTCAQYAN